MTHNEVFNRPTVITPSGRDVSDLYCPHCDRWIGDPDDDEIRDISTVHDVSACGDATPCEQCGDPLPEEPPRPGPKRRFCGRKTDPGSGCAYTRWRASNNRASAASRTRRRKKA